MNAGCCHVVDTDFLVSVEELAARPVVWRSLGILNLEACAPDAVIDTLPPYPLLGIGSPAHRLANRMDALIEPPIAASSVISSVCRAPFAAATLTHLLRSIGMLGLQDGLVQESIAYAMLQGSREHIAWRTSRPVCRTPAPPGSVIVERAGDIVHILLNRPLAHNAIDRTMRDDLHAAFMVAVLDTDVTGISLRAAGAAFSIGADLDEFGSTRDPATAHLIRARTLPAAALALRPGLLDVHVQGACIGAALEIAAFARHFTASGKAWFQLPELAMGILPGAGGCVSLTRRIGRQRTALMILSGARLRADKALAWGLVDRIIDG